MLQSNKPFKSSNKRIIQSKNNHQSIIVQVKIGSNMPVKSIHIEDINNIEKIKSQIRLFISNNSLKQEAYEYIKSLILKQIDKKMQKAKESANASQKKCKYQAIMQQFEKKQKKKAHNTPNSSNMMGNMSFSKTPQKHTHKQSQLTKSNFNSKMSEFQSVNTKKEQQLQSFIFNSSFTLPSSVGQKNPVFFTDQLFQYAFQTQGQHKHSEDFTDLSEFQTSRQKIQVNKMKASPIKIKLQQNQLQLLSPNFMKNSQEYANYTPKKQKNLQSVQNQQNQNKQAYQSQKKTRSTRQRKLAIMTPKHTHNMQASKQNLLVINAQNLCAMVSQHQKNLKQMQQTAVKHVFDQIQAEQRCLPERYQQILMVLFQKLTHNNPLQIKQLHPQYISYQKLCRQQLHLMGVLFEKVDHKQLNNLSYENFKMNSLKYCWHQLQQLAQQQEIKKHLSNLHNDSNKIQFF